MVASGTNVPIILFSQKPELIWLNKISSNVARDLRNNEMLKAQGWLVIRVWEHDIKKSLENTVTNIVDALQKRKDSIHVKSY